MNKIRKFWINNGTPFFFHMSFNQVDSDFVHLSPNECQAYDNVEFDSDKHLTCLDALVDLNCIYKSLQRVSDPMIINSILHTLKSCFETVQYVYSLSNNKS